MRWRLAMALATVALVRLVVVGVAADGRTRVRRTLWERVRELHGLLVRLLLLLLMGLVLVRWRLMLSALRHLLALRLAPRQLGLLLCLRRRRGEPSLVLLFLALLGEGIGRRRAHLRHLCPGECDCFPGILACRRRCDCAEVLGGGVVPCRGRRPEFGRNAESCAGGSAGGGWWGTYAGVGGDDCLRGCGGNALWPLPCESCAFAFARGRSESQAESAALSL